MLISFFKTNVSASAAAERMFLLTLLKWKDINNIS